MASHAAFELDFYRQTAVVFSHSLGHKRTLTTKITCILYFPRYNPLNRILLVPNFSFKNLKVAVGHE